MAGSVRTPTAWAVWAALLLALNGTLLVPGAAAACGKTHPYVGFSGDLTTMDHNVRTLGLESSTQRTTRILPYPTLSTDQSQEHMVRVFCRQVLGTCIIATVWNTLREAA